MERSWDNYLEFEAQPNLVDPERYRALLDELISRQPDMEYFAVVFGGNLTGRAPGWPRKHRVHENSLHSSQDGPL